VALRISVDTNSYSNLCRGDDRISRLVGEAEAVFLPFIVLGELRAGFAVGNQGLENERTLQRFLAKPGVELLLPSDMTTRTYAGLFRQLRSQGTPIPTNDLWIAALVLERNLVLCTQDAHFRSLPQLNLI